MTGRATSRETLEAAAAVSAPQPSPYVGDHVPNLVFKPSSANPAGFNA